MQLLVKQLLLFIHRSVNQDDLFNQMGFFLVQVTSSPINLERWGELCILSMLMKRCDPPRQPPKCIIYYYFTIKSKQQKRNRRESRYIKQELVLFFFLFKTMPPNTDAYRVVPEFTLRRTLPHTVLQSCNEEDFFFLTFLIYIFIYIYCTHGKKNNPDWTPGRASIWP